MISLRETLFGLCGMIAIVGANSGWVAATETAPKPNVLLIMADDLTSTALSCYGNELCKTPNIDSIAARGTRFTRAYCQGTYCGPSRASMLSGFYPHATGVLNYASPREAIGDRATWPQHFKNSGYYTARVSKIFHMGIPGGVELDSQAPDFNEGNGSDDPISWTERFNSLGPEWRAAGEGETLEGNPDGSKPVMGGNTFVVVEADGDDDIHSDGKTANKVVEILQRQHDAPFFLAVGFVRPHVPFVAPRKYYDDFLPYDKLPLPPKLHNEWKDVPKAGINYKTSQNMQMDERRQKKAIGGYYASVAYLDAMVGKVLKALERSGHSDNTIVIFTSDHGYHLGEHDFWAKVSLREESASVPLIISVPGMKASVSNSIVELLDLYPTVSQLAGLNPPEDLQGLDITPILKDPTAAVRQEAFSVAPMRNGFLLRSEDWAYIQYGENASDGIELYDMKKDPNQYRNLAQDGDHAELVSEFQKKLSLKLTRVRDNKLGRSQ